MRTELIDLFSAYLSGWKTLRDCAEWLAGLDWANPGLAPDVLEVAERAELLATEVAEGLRQEADFRQTVAEFVAHETDTWYIIQPSLAEFVAANSSNDIPSWPPVLTPAEV